MDKKRYEEIDILRGVAILLMIITHINGFFAKGNIMPLDLITYLGATVCFTVFLFCFSFLYGIKRDKVEGKHILKSLKRAGVMILVYFLLAVFVFWIKNKGLSANDFVSILTLRTIPEYIEYILPFIWLMVLFPFMQMVLRKINNLFIWFILILLVFAASYLMTLLPSGTGIMYYVQLVFGTVTNNHTFGIVAYLPVILIGYLWGSLFDREVLRYDNKVKFSVVILLVLLVAEFGFKYLFHMEWFRWPPNLLFINYGLVFLFAILSAYYAIPQIRKLFWFIENIGQYATQYLIVHITLLYVIAFFFNFQKLDEIFIPAIFLFIFVIMELLKKFTYKDHYKYIAKLGYVGGISALLLIIALWTSYRRLAIANENPDNPDDTVVNVCQTYTEFFNDPFNTLSRNRKWFLKDYYKKESDTSLYVEGEFKQFINTQGRTLQIYGGNLLVFDEAMTNKNLVSNSSVMMESEGTFNASLQIESLPVSTYKYKLSFSTECGNIESSKYVFYVSKPVYVSWTIDWEGIKIPDGHLKYMEDISSTYNVPMTHFFNPRYFVTKTYAKTYTDWILARIKLGDDVGMHMHMFPDLVEAAGVIPKTNPRWGQTSPGDGYDILVTAYTYEELFEIFKWGRNKMIQNRLPIPVLYRSGGWFANLDTLKAAYDAGFLVDSSGRTQYTIGSNAPTTYWNLLSTTQPYKPSKSNQNIGGGTTIGIWEIPNNGGDSWAFSKDQMYSRFKANFSGLPAKDKKLVTYLSHPEWFYVDKPKIEGLFSDISKYLYEKDNGPVSFINQTTAYEIWSE